MTRKRLSWWGMAGMLCGVAGAMVGWKANAETIAITGGTVALGDGSQPIPDGMVVIRDGRIVAAGGMKMKLPAGTQVIDATGKWVTPGIVAGFSRLGLADVDLTASREDGGGKSDTSGTADDTTSDGPFNAAIDVVPAINPHGHHYRRQSRRWSDPRGRCTDCRQEHLRRSGRGDRHRGGYGCGHGAAEISVRRARPDRGAECRRLACVGAHPVPQRPSRSRRARPLRACRGWFFVSTAG